MRLIGTVILTSLLLTGAGCSKPPETKLTIIPPPPKLESINLPGEVKIESVGFNKNFTLNDFASCDLDITYPSFPNGELDEVQRLQIEHEVARYIASVLGSQAEINSPAELDSIANVYLAECQTEITNEYNDLSSSGEELFTNLRRYVNVNYTVNLNQDQLLSISLAESSYGGGAHPNYTSTAINADRTSGKLVMLEDIIAADYLDDLKALEETRLLAAHDGDLYPDVLDERESLKFYLTPTALITYYLPYEIAPYAAGPIEVELTYEEIKDFIDSNATLRPLVE